MKQCKNCGGDGYLIGLIRVDCAACGGTGAIIEQQCFCCDGVGAIETVATDILCSARHGTGETTEEILSQPLR